jgi:hypothetical protein
LPQQRKYLLRQHDMPVPCVPSIARYG